MLKNPPAKQEMWVRSIQEDPLEKEMATYSSILACEIPWTSKPGKLLSMWLQIVNTTEQLSTHTHTVFIHMTYII